VRDTRDMSSISRVRALSATLCMAAVLVGCSHSPSAPDPAPAPVPVTPPPPPPITIAPPALLGPTNGARYFGWPTLTVRNAERTNTNNALVYRFEISAREDFAAVNHSWIAPESPDQTSYDPPPTQVPSSEGTYFWRAVAIDQANAVQSPPSLPWTFQYLINTEQNRIADQAHGGLWGDARPTGTRGRAKFGPGWQVRVLRSFDGVTFQSPPLETLRLYDLLDLGYSPQAAIDWMSSKGYPLTAVWYPGPAAIGFPFQYMALINGSWELVVRVGA
jgi:hypothetical protein